MPILCANTKTVQRDLSLVRKTLLALAQHIIMPDRCLAGGCSNIRKDGASLHKRPEDTHFAKLWTNVINPTLSRLCRTHFADDYFEEQSAIAKSLGL